MMRWLVGSSLKARFIVAALAAALLFFGVAALRDTPIDVFPEFAPPTVEIQTPSLGLSASEVESLVTVPLEQALNGVDELEILRSKSVAQLSSIELVFEQGVDIIEARERVQERLATVAATLPTWASPPFMLPPVSATSRVMMIGLSSDTVSLIDLSAIAYWTIRARLLQVPGVANVGIWGERLKQLHVQVDPARLAARDVSLLDVMEATGSALDAGLLQFSEGAVVGTGGFIETPNQRLGIRHVSPIRAPSDLARVSIRREGGEPLVLSDVADVVEAHPPLAGDAVVNGGPGLLLVVQKLPWANTLEVTRGLDEALRALEPGLPGIAIDADIFRPAGFIEASIDNLRTSLIIGALLVVLILGAFLFEWRVALISVAAIPLSLVAAGLVLRLAGVTINVMVLSGFVIALGAVVDDAIIDVENVVRRLREHRRGGGGRAATAAIILRASLEVRSAILYATMILLVAVVPVFFLQGLSAAFFRPLVLAYGLALLASMAVALTVTPALSLILLARAPIERRESPLVRALQRGYGMLLRGVIARPMRAYAVTGSIAVAGFAVAPFLGESLFPEFKERNYLMHWVSPPSTSLAEEARITRRAGRELLAVAGVVHQGTHIGQALLSDEVVGSNFGEHWINTDPASDYDATLAAVRRIADSTPGLYRDVQTYLGERINEVLTGAGEAIVIRLFGPDLDVLRTTAERVRDAIASVPGVVDEHVDFEVDVPQIEVEVNLAAAERYGVKPGDVRRAAATLVASEEVGDIFRDGKAYDVHVWSTPETRNSLSSIRGLLIDTPAGDRVRLDELADVRIAPTPNVIEREAASRRIDVGANVDQGDLGAVVAAVEERLSRVDLPLGYHAEMLGEITERRAAARRLIALAVAAAICIALLLQAAFRSWRLALLACLALPVALAGGALGAILGGGVLSLGSLVGFLAVLGIAARNAIMLLSHYQHLEQQEEVAFGPELVLRGARERLAPILMTTLTTALALVPVVAVGSVAGHEIDYPMAIVILGGLLTSTLVNLVALPPLYLRLGHGRTLRHGAPAAREP